MKAVKFTNTSRELIGKNNIQTIMIALIINRNRAGSINEIIRSFHLTNYSVPNSKNKNEYQTIDLMALSSHTQTDIHVNIAVQHP